MVSILKIQVKSLVVALLTIQVEVLKINAVSSVSEQMGMSVSRRSR